MILRAPLHLLALVGLLMAFGSQPARSQPDVRLAPNAAASRIHLADTRTSAAAARGQLAPAATNPLTNTLYLPSIVRVAPPPVDLSIDSLEITQAIQTPSNSVPLIAGRPAIVRVYARHSGTTVPGSVSVSLTGERDGVELPPVTLGPQAVSASPSRASYSSSFNVPLPTSWLSGTVSMTATIDPDDAVAESDETNNTSTTTLTFNTVPALDLVIVPVRYTDLSNGQTYDPPAVDTISDFIKRTYPLSTIKVTFHPAMNFTGDLGDTSGFYWANKSGTGLLNRVTAVKIGEVGEDSPKIYYGLVPTGTNPSNTWLPSSGGFILGIGWVGSRESAGLDIPASFGLPADTTSDTAAHEIGHNLGRQHAP
ncbi:MAG TPA: CARDB domain-containing protein, partial [Roseiflexaceae bacterium]|nr:CARDB domain-containing protein [Roseiflexaceae bacterium]